MTALVTKKLSGVCLEILQLNGWHVDQVEALQINHVEVDSSPESDVWIISSRNSWKAVGKLIELAPPFIYCIGAWMVGEIEKANPAAHVRSFNSMRSLSDELKTRDFSRLIYFCGDHHRAELTEALKGRRTLLTKIVTHHSTLAYPIIKRKYEAVFIFSPRSAKSLLKHNVFANETAFACIGPTTASYLHKQGITNIFCPSSPDSEILVREFCQWYNRSLDY